MYIKSVKLPLVLSIVMPFLVLQANFKRYPVRRRVTNTSA